MGLSSLSKQLQSSTMDVVVRSANSRVETPTPTCSSLHIDKDSSRGQQHGNGAVYANQGSLKDIDRFEGLN